MFFVLQPLISHHPSYIIANSLNRPKIVLTRDLGPDSMSLLQQTQIELEASIRGRTAFTTPRFKKKDDDFVPC